MNDELISKQKILNTLKEWQSEDLPHTMYGDGYEDAVSDIIKLIETEVPVGAETKVMNDDLISRQAAIDKLKEHRAMYCDNTPDTFSILFYAEKIRVDELDTAIATLVNLPSAQPEIEPKTGRWKHVEIESNKSDTGYFMLPRCECSVCDMYVEQESNYCPNCGADMRSKAREYLEYGELITKGIAQGLRGDRRQNDG